MPMDPIFAQFFGGHQIIKNRELTFEDIMKLRRPIAWSIPDNIIPVMNNVEDIAIPGPNGEITLRVYAPEVYDKASPAIIFLHGGGWCVGDLDSHDLMARQISKASGYKLFSVDYRLAPEHPFPQGLEDCYAALEWVSSHCGKLGVDASRICIVGESAGGNLAAGVTLMAREHKRPIIWKQVLMYPAVIYLSALEDTDFYSFHEHAVTPLLTSVATKSFWDFYVPNEADRNNHYHSPLTVEDLSELPAALIITGECDPLRDEGEAYGARLIEAGVSIKGIRYDGMIHGFMSLPIPMAFEAIQAISEFLKED